MQKDYIVLKDGTRFYVEPLASISNMIVILPDKFSVIELWDKITVDNLERVEAYNQSGELIGEYNNLLLPDPEIKLSTLEDGRIKLMLEFIETEKEKDYQAEQLLS